MTKKAWLTFVLVAGLGSAVLLSVHNSFKPGVEDVKDPLGRPSALSLEVIHSASEFDRISADLVPKHGTLAQRIRKLDVVTGDLETVVGAAGELPGKAASVNADTTTVSEVAGPLPILITNVTDRAVQAAPVVGNLGRSVDAVTTQLVAIQGQLDGALTDLTALGPRATTIVALLRQIQRESEKIKPLAPILNGLSGPLDTVYDLPLVDQLLGLLQQH